MDFGSDVSQIHARLRDAAYHGVEELVKKLAARLDDDIDQPSNDSRRIALHLAARSGFDNIVRFLVERNPNVHAQNLAARTPLQYAALSGNPRSVLALIAKGAEIKHDDTHGMTAIHIAAGNVQILSLLKSSIQSQRYDMGTRNVDGRTPLMCAAASSSLEAFQYILNNFNSVDLAESDNEGLNCVHTAAKVGSADLLKFLLDQGLNFDGKTRSGSTAPHLAAELESHMAEIVRTLLQHQANPLATRTDSCNPIHLIFRSLRPEAPQALAQLLAACPRDGSAHEASRKDEDGNTPLHYIAVNPKIETSSILMIESLLAQPDTNTIDTLNKDSWTPSQILISRLVSDDLDEMGRIETLLSPTELLLPDEMTTLNLVDSSKPGTSLHYICSVSLQRVGFWTEDVSRDVTCSWSGFDY